MAPTRRALIAGLAVLPAFATTTTPPPPPPAPIRSLLPLSGTAPPAPQLEGARARYAAAEQEITAAYDAMLATAPQTTRGAWRWSTT